MKILVAIAVLALLPQFASADHGGPYQFVSDHKKDDPIHTTSLDGEIARPLPFFLKHFPIVPTNNAELKKRPLQWRPLKPNDPHLSMDRLDDFGSGSLLVVNFVRRDLLQKGVLRKSGVMLLAPEKDQLFKVVYLAEQGSANVVETYSVKTMKLLKGEKFLRVTCHYSGSGGHRAAQYFRWKPGKLVRHEIWASGSKFQKEIKEAGWEFWHRGHWSEPTNQATFTTVYRPPEKAKGGRSGHAQIKIEYEWENEQLVAKRWKVMP